MGNRGRVAIAAAGVAVALVLFLLLRPGGDDEADVTPAAQETQETQATTGETETETGAATNSPTTTDSAPDVVQARITIGPDGPSGVERIDASLNQRVVLTVRSEIQDHVHVHGYDLFADVGPGRQARITFRADVPGRFEIELEDRHQPVAELRVRP
jgi:hypothetical protein